MPCVGGGRVLGAREEEYAAQLIVMHTSDYAGREYLEEAVIAQIDTLHWLHSIARFRFFWQMDERNSRLAGCWLYYGFTGRWFLPQAGFFELQVDRATDWGQSGLSAVLCNLLPPSLLVLYV